MFELTCPEHCAWSIVKIMLHRRLAATVLVMALLASNTATAAVCRAYCAGIGNNRAAHHHQMETRASAHSHHVHANHHGPSCPECSSMQGRLSMQAPGCGKFTQVQALQESVRAFSADREDLQSDVTQTSISSLAKPIENARFSPLYSPPQLSSFHPVLVSLRI
jgi:hypothetical protein